jgi:hypothetical protein
MILTYWFYSYLVWFFPFTALALFSPQPARRAVALTAEEPGSGTLPGTLVPA